MTSSQEQQQHQEGGTRPTRTLDEILASMDDGDVIITDQQQLDPTALVFATDPAAATTKTTSTETNSATTKPNSNPKIKSVTSYDDGGYGGGEETTFTLKKQQQTVAFSSSSKQQNQNQSQKPSRIAQAQQDQRSIEFGHRRVRSTGGTVHLEPRHTGDTKFRQRAHQNTAKAGTFHMFCEWMSLPRSIFEWIVSVDLYSIHRRHLVWAKAKSGDELLKLVISRYASTSVFLSLLVGAEIGILFSPSSVMENVRFALYPANGAYQSIEYAAGFALCMAIIFAIVGLLANFTAWSTFVVVSPENAAIVLRSSIGLYASNLPAYLAIGSIYTFIISICLFWWVILRYRGAIALTLLVWLLVLHVASTFSAMSRVIMATSAMSDLPILCKEEEETLTPSQLNDLLVFESRLAQQANIDVMKQYRMDYHEHIRDLDYDPPYCFGLRRRKASAAAPESSSTTRGSNVVVVNDIDIHRMEEGMPVTSVAVGNDPSNVKKE